MKNVPELRFSNFCDEWVNYKLGEIVDIRGRIGFRGYTKSDIINKEDGGVLTFSPTNIIYNKLKNTVHDTYITKEKYEESPEIMVKTGDILFVKTGSTLGKSTLVANLNEEATVNPQIVVMRVKVFFHQKFTSTYLTLNKILRQVAQTRIGGAIPTLTESEIKKFQVSFPVYEEQQKIGEFFSKLDRQIELEEQKLAKLEEQKKGYMQKIFSQELGFKDENGNEYPTWQSYKLGNLYKKGKAGGTPKSTESKYYNGEVPFLSISDITKQGKFIMNTEKSITQEGVDNSTAWLVPVNSINYAMYASVGYLSINKIEVATSQAIFNMVFEDNNLVEYIYYYLNHIRDKGILEKLVGTGTQSNLSASIMKSIYIKLPDYEEMVKITVFLSKVDKLIEKQNQKIDGLKKRKQGLLQKMFV